MKWLILAAILLILVAQPAFASEENIGETASVASPTPYAVNVSISPNSRSGASGNLTYTVTVTNQGDNADNYDLAVGDTLGWTVSLSDNLFENIAPSGSDVTTLTVTLGASGTDTITVTATSQGDNTVSDNASCTATVQPGGGPVPPEPEPEKPKEEISPDVFWLGFISWIAFATIGGHAAVQRRWPIKDFYLVALVALFAVGYGLYHYGVLGMGNAFLFAFGSWLVLILIGGYAVEKRRMKIGDFYIVATTSLFLLVTALVKVGILEAIT